MGRFNLDKKIVAIIQARMTSTRLPGKVLKPIFGKALLWYVFNRVKKARKVNQVVIAASSHPSDEKIIDFSKINKINYFRGSLNNVLERYYKAAQKYNADVIVRITADCPLIDPGIIDRLINFFQKNKKCDYAAILIHDGENKGRLYPDGMDVEIFTLEALKKAYLKAKTAFQKEHVTPFIKENPSLFKTGFLRPQQNYPPIKLSVDTIDDFTRIKQILKKFMGGIDFDLDDIMRLLTK